VTGSKGSGKVKGKSILSFGVETLTHRGLRIPIRSYLKSVANSKGMPDVDEEGFLVKKTNNLGKVAAATAIGSLIGAMVDGGRGAAIGAGAGAAASLLFIKFAVQGPSITFDPGSEFVIGVDQGH